MSKLRQIQIQLFDNTNIKKLSIYMQTKLNKLLNFHIRNPHPCVNMYPSQISIANAFKFDRIQTPRSRSVVKEYPEWSPKKILCIFRLESESDHCFNLTFNYRAHNRFIPYCSNAMTKMRKRKTVSKVNTYTKKDPSKNENKSKRHSTFQKTTHRQQQQQHAAQVFPNNHFWAAAVRASGAHLSVKSHGSHHNTYQLDKRVRPREIMRTHNARCYP